MSFTQFIKPYPDGYEDFEVGGTPVTAEILNTNYDGFLLALNEFLPELEGMVEANPSEQATAGNLTKLKVGNSIYLIPSGGSGGSTVEWEQIQLTGTKIATITIDNVPIDVYAPSGGSGDEVSWNQVVGSGTKIGTITINGDPTDVYAPTPIDVEANPSDSATAGDLTKLKVGSSIYSIPSGGSGGASDLSDLGDVTITNVQDGQILKWNSTTLKWENSNESGGGGTGGHTIIDENGNSMTARAGLQFVGADVSDDATNNKTIVDLASAGGIDGVFYDMSNVIVQRAEYDATQDFSYTATQDCAIFIEIVNIPGSGKVVRIDGEWVESEYSVQTGSHQIRIGQTFLLKKGQTLTVVANATAFESVCRYAVYGIQTGTTHSKFQPVIYSLEEREVGVWTDGKPLYQKTFIVNPTQATEMIDISSLHIDKMVSRNTTCTRDTGSSGIQQKDVQYRSESVGSDTYGLICEIRGTDLYFDISGYNYSQITEIRATLQYTKSTDTAGSGSWTPQGVPAVHYSTDEQIVGTWIDGSTLYEKTFDNLSISVTTKDTWTNTGIDATYMDKIIDGKLVDAYYQHIAGIVGFVNNATEIGITTSIDSRTIIAIIIQYTKTS